MRLCVSLHYELILFNISECLINADCPEGDRCNNNICVDSPDSGVVLINSITVETKVILKLYSLHQYRELSHVMDVTPTMREFFSTLGDK